MTPYKYVLEELGNVRRLLSDTLRHEYGPDHSGPYYTECDLRLKHISNLLVSADKNNTQEISSIHSELSQVAWRIAMIERAHLGEYSWPFANEIRKIAEAILYDETLTDRSPPIVHVIAESHGYRIINEGSFKHSPGRRRIAVVEFPRTLKHQVLFHPLLGHEICHTGFNVPAFIRKLNIAVVRPLLSNSKLLDLRTANAWINDTSAPTEVRSKLASYNARSGPFTITAEQRLKWIIEVICDIFGLVLFGPSFLAAHNALLSAFAQAPYVLSLTHPPDEIRSKVLLQCMKAMSWDSPSTNGSHKEAHQAECDLLQKLCADNYHPWVSIFEDSSILQSITNLQALLALDGVKGYQKVGGSPLEQLIKKLSRNLPPIIDTINQDGEPDLIPLDVGAILYAGWIYAENGADLNAGKDPSFFDTNRLCEHALLQREAIVLAKGA